MTTEDNNVSPPQQSVVTSLNGLKKQTTVVSKSFKKKEKQNEQTITDDNAYSFTKLYQKPFKYETSQNNRITEEQIDQVRDRKLKEIEVKAAKEREKLEIVIILLNLFLIQERLHRIARMQ